MRPCRRCRKSQRAAGGAIQIRQPLVLDPWFVTDVRRGIRKDGIELATPDDDERDLGAERRRGKDRLDSMERDQLPHEEHCEVAGRAYPRLKQPILSADVADCEAISRDAEARAEVRGMCGCVRDDEVGCTEGVAVDRSQEARAQRPGRYESAIVDHRVLQRHERVEHEWAIARHPSSRRHVDVAGVADDNHIEPDRGSASESKLGAKGTRVRSSARRQLVPLRLPQTHMAFDNVYACPAQARNHLGVPGVVALVRAEVEDAHRVASARPRRRTAPRARAR